MLDPRAIATLGVGFGPRQVVAIGLAPHTHPARPSPSPLSSAGGSPARRRRRRDEEEALLIGLII
jgi:hypothetical protein